MQLRELNLLTGAILGAAIEVHSICGPGLLESSYESCLCHEFSLRDIPFVRQHVIDVAYKGQNLGAGYRIDLLAFGQIVIELKAVEQLLPVHQAQLLTYLKLGPFPAGLLINFNVPRLKQGIQRMLNTRLE